MNRKLTIALLLLLVVKNGNAQLVKQPVLGYRSAAIITVDKLQFKDLNRNGKLDPYEDWRLSCAIYGQTTCLKNECGR